MALVDLSGSMLRAAAETILNDTKDIDTPKLAVMRAEFKQLADLRMMLPEGFCDESKPVIYLLLGQTFGNLTPDDAMGLFERNCRVGDVAIVGLDLAKTVEGEIANRENTKAMYVGDETKAVWRRGADVGNTSGKILDPTIDEKYGPGTFSVVGYHLFRDFETEVFRSTRWDERLVRRMFEEKSFVLVADAASPTRQTYKLLVWRRIR
ncbi:MAG: L-histidine N(alpha)-methyltransferase [Rhizomicrobium sp.]